MSIELEFNKKKLHSEIALYAVERIAGPGIAELKSSEKITFKRSGTDASEGFTITFEGKGAPGPLVVAAGSSSVQWTAPKVASSTTYKYTVTFPNDEKKSQVVVELDPVIIINPSISSFLLSVQAFTVFMVGAAVAYIVMRFI
jgi:hypothetical protein